MTRKSFLIDIHVWLVYDTVCCLLVQLLLANLFVHYSSSLPLSKVPICVIFLGIRRRSSNSLLDRHSLVRGRSGEQWYLTRGPTYLFPFQILLENVGKSQI
jgi:hypothetical protein